MANNKRAAPALPPCDCLNYCGDDPWLTQGKAEWCGEVKRRRAAVEKDRAECQSIVARLSSLADEMLADREILRRAAELITNKH